MGTVSVDSNTYDVYGDLAGAKIYIAGVTTSAGALWRALANDNEKSRFVLAARRFIDRQDWQGTAVLGLPPLLQWPRLDVYYSDGTAVSSAAVPQQIIDAEYELAAIFAGNAAAYEAANSGSNIKSLRAEPVEIEFFTGTLTSGLATKFPQAVQDLIGQFLDNAQGITRSTESGSCGESHFDNSGCVTPYTRNGPF